MRFKDYKTFRTAIGGRLLQVEVGKVAGMANGAATIRYGDTVVNVTATCSAEPREDIDFFPLSCDYEERCTRRERFREVLSSGRGVLPKRRSLSQADRPSDPPAVSEGLYNDVVVVATVMCVDHDCPSDITAMVGSSVALSMSDIPWDGPDPVRWDVWTENLSSTRHRLRELSAISI